MSPRPRVRTSNLLSCVHIGRRVEVGHVCREERDDRDELARREWGREEVSLCKYDARGAHLSPHNGLYGMDGQPTLSGVLVAILIITWGVLQEM